MSKEPNNLPTTPCDCPSNRICLNSCGDLSRVAIANSTLSQLTLSNLSFSPGPESGYSARPSMSIPTENISNDYSRTSFVEGMLPIPSQPPFHSFLSTSLWNTYGKWSRPRSTSPSAVLSYKSPQSPPDSVFQYSNYLPPISAAPTSSSRATTDISSPFRGRSSASSSSSGRKRSPPPPILIVPQTPGHLVVATETPFPSFMSPLSSVYLDSASQYSTHPVAVATDGKLPEKTRRRSTGGLKDGQEIFGMEEMFGHTMVNGGRLWPLSA